MVNVKELKTEKRPFDWKYWKLYRQHTFAQKLTHTHILHVHKGQREAGAMTIGESTNQMCLNNSVLFSLTSVDLLPID